MYDTAFEIKGTSFHAVSLAGGLLYMVNQGEDTIVKENAVNDCILKDIDGNGLPDLMISHISNVPGIADLFMFDERIASFRKVEDFSRFPAAEDLKGTSCFYSYHRSGCADRNWDSDLFYIKDFKTYCIGNIAGRECGDTDPKDGIYISTVRGDSAVLIERFLSIRSPRIKITNGVLLKITGRNIIKSLPQL